MQILSFEVILSIAATLLAAMAAVFAAYVAAKMQSRSTKESPLLIEKLRIYANLAREISILVGEDTRLYDGKDVWVISDGDIKMVGSGGHSFKFKALGVDDYTPITEQGNVLIHNRLSHIKLLSIEVEFLAGDKLGKKMPLLRACVNLILPIDDEPYSFESYMKDELRDARRRYKLEAEKRGDSKEQIGSVVSGSVWIEDQRRLILSIESKIGKVNQIISSLKHLKELWPELKQLMMKDISS